MNSAAALAKFEDYTKYRDFKRFHIQQAIGFKGRPSEHISSRTGERLIRGTVFSTLNVFQWLSTQPGYRSRLSSADAEYFALSDREARIAKAIAERPVPTIDQIRHVLQTMPAVTDIELRNRAVVAFTLLTGARDGAIASLKCKHVDVIEGKVVQDAREVRWLPSPATGWIDLESGTLHRAGTSERESNKRKPPARIHARLLPHLRRWHRLDSELGITHVAHYMGAPIHKLRRAWASVGGGKDGPHVVRHTAATWLMQAGVDAFEAAGYLGMSVEILLEVYGHHHPAFQEKAARATGRRS